MKEKRLPSSLCSPAYPAALLIFGLIFAQATTYFMSLPWLSLYTAVIYAIPFAWCMLILRNRISLPMKPNAIDISFAAFVLVVLISALVFPGPDQHGSVWKYLRFLPFLMITPYVLGRLMRLPDIELFSRITLFAGLVLLLLLMLDRLTVVERPGRLPIFGFNYGPLLVSVLLAALLQVLCAHVLSGGKPGEKGGLLRQLVLLWLIGCVTVVLVWIMARGRLLASLTGVAVMSFVVHSRSIALRTGLAAYVFGIATLALLILPSSAFYSAILSAPTLTPNHILIPAPTHDTEFCPILGETSCQPFKEGVNSVAMRWLLYHEAMAMFMQKPVWGVGTARFGDCSCTGPGWYPHNTILQGLAELGLVGGGLQLGLFVLAVATLMRPLLSMRQLQSYITTHAFVLALFVLFLVSDQFYGNYLMAAGTWLTTGIAASFHGSNNCGDDGRV